MPPHNTDDVRIRELKELTPPAHLIREFACSEAASELIYNSRQSMHRILHGMDDRLIVVIGPCSIHDTKAAIEYAGRLVKERERFKGELEIVMRVYFTDKDPQEIIASVKNGLYAVNFGGGQVDITNGKFVFSASEAYMIENGKITYPVKGATLIGSGPESLKDVSMIGNDMSLDSGVGVCGKEGQSVPVGVGQPTLRIDRMTVGGTA